MGVKDVRNELLKRYIMAESQRLLGRVFAMSLDNLFAKSSVEVGIVGEGELIPVGTVQTFKWISDNDEFEVVF